MMKKSRSSMKTLFGVVIVALVVCTAAVLERFHEYEKKKDKELNVKQVHRIVSPPVSVLSVIVRE